MPTVSTAEKIGEAHGQPEYPTDLLYCENCDLIQIGIVIDPKVLFQPKYTYTSSTTRILRENFAELYREATELIDLKKKDLVVDIGSNDGNLLSNFKDNHRVLGVTPEQIGKMAIKKGIPTIIDYFRAGVVAQIKKKYGKAKIVTATNVFAHIEDVNQVVKNILNLMTPDGVFISESGYVITLLKETQYDNVYHEHLRYYSLHSIKYLLNMHGLEVFHAKRIPTHGGSIRVYASRKGQNKVLPSVKALLKEEEDSFSNKKLFAEFKKNVIASKLGLYDILSDIKKKNKRIYAISAPARATTLVHYVGLDENIIECVLEVQGSQKIGTYVPGTLIPIFEESKLMKDQPEYALLLSWHIAKHLMPKMKQSGFKGDFIVPLPKPMIVLNKDVKA
jgi:SAM-dependent methyltransferase